LDPGNVLRDAFQSVVKVALIYKPKGKMSDCGAWDPRI